METYKKCDKCGGLALNPKKVTLGFVLLYEPGHWLGSGSLCDSCFEQALEALKATGLALKFQADSSPSKGSDEYSKKS